MNCQDARERMNDYVDGALSQDTHRKIADHLAACSDCRAAEQELRMLVAELRGLPAELPPPRDLWSGIAGRLDEARPGRARWFARWRPVLAAAALVIVGLAVPLLVRTIVGDGEADGGRTATAPAATGSGGGAENAEAVELAFRDAKQLIRSTLEEHRDTLSPETVRRVNENLEILDGAIGEIELALAKDPGNPGLRKMLVATHNRELGLLKRLNQIISKQQRSQ